MHNFVHFKFNLPKRMFIFSVVYAIFCFSVSLAGSIFPLYLKEFSESVFAIGLIAAIVPILGSLLSILIGDAVDKYGTKRFILTGLVSMSLLFIGYYFSPIILVVISIQIFMAVARELVYTPFFALVRDGSKKDELAESFSLVQTLATAGYIIGPLVAGYIALTNVRLPFVLAAIGLLAAYAVMFYAKEPRYKKRDVSIGFRALRNAWNDFRALGREGRNLAFTLFSLHTWYSAKWFMGPLLLIYLGLNASDVGIWLSISLVPFLLLSLPFGSFVDNHRDNVTKALVWGMMLSAIPLAFLGFSSGMWLYFFIVAIAIGNALSDILIESRITDITPSNEYGEVSGILDSIKNLGGMVGPIMTTFFAQFFGFQYSFLPVLAMFFVSIYLLYKTIPGR